MMIDKFSAISPIFRGLEYLNLIKKFKNTTSKKRISVYMAGYTLNAAINSPENKKAVAR